MLFYLIVETICLEQHLLWFCHSWHLVGSPVFFSGLMSSGVVYSRHFLFNSLQSMAFCTPTQVPLGGARNILLGFFVFVKIALCE
jgi:hypothetical protein